MSNKTQAEITLEVLLWMQLMKQWVQHESVFTQWNECWMLHIGIKAYSLFYFNMWQVDDPETTKCGRHHFIFRRESINAQWVDMIWGSDWMVTYCSSRLICVGYNPDRTMTQCTFTHTLTHWMFFFLFFSFNKWDFFPPVELSDLPPPPIPSLHPLLDLSQLLSESHMVQIESNASYCEICIRGT